MAKDLALRLKKCLELRHQNQRKHLANIRNVKAEDNVDSCHVQSILQKDVLAHDQKCSHCQLTEIALLEDDEACRCQLPSICAHNVGTNDDILDDVHPQAARQKCQSYFNPQTPPVAFTSSATAISNNSFSNTCNLILQQHDNNNDGYRASIATIKPLLEAYEKGAWWDVELLGLEKDKLLVHFLGYGDKVIEQEFLRYRTRRAYDDDCKYYLEPGMDVAVFSKHPYDLSGQLNLAWYDGKLISIHRTEHKSNCQCIFEIQFYQANKTDLLGPPSLRPLVTGVVVHLNIEQLGIFQTPILKDMQTGTQFENINARVWSVDTKTLPWPIFADISKVPASFSEWKEVCVCETKSKLPVTVGTADMKLPCQHPHRTFGRRFVGNTTQRARGVNIATYSEQAHEASLLEIAKIEPREMIDRRQLSHEPSNLQQRGGASAQFKDSGDNQGKLPVNEQKIISSLSKECGCFAEKTFATMTGVAQVNGHNYDFQQPMPVELRQTSVWGQRAGFQQYMHSFSAQGMRAFVGGAFKSPHAEPEGEFPRLKARKKNLRRYSLSKKSQKRIHLLSSLIDSVIKQSKKGWQRRVSILISKQLCHSRLMQKMQHALAKPGKTSNSSKAHSGERMSVVGTNAPSNKKEFSRSRQEILWKQCKAETDACQFIKDLKFSFNEFFKRAVQSENIKDVASCLDWTKLTQKYVRNNMVSGSKEIEREMHPKGSSEIVKDFPLKRKRKQGQKDPYIASKRKTQKSEEFIELEDSKFSFRKLLTKAKQDSALPMPDWSILQARTVSAHQIPWDPIIFHEDSLDHPREADKEDTLVEILWRHMDFSLARDNFNVEHKEEYTIASQVNIISCEGCHDFVLEENEGLICQTCGLVGCNIEEMIPLKVQENSALHAKHKERLHEDDDVDFRTALDPAPIDQEDFACTTDNQLGKDASQIHLSVWDLIPELKDKMHAHQKDGFEFLWRSLAGSMGPSSVEGSTRQEIGGCIISHAPGTGKTFLIISFLQSYMQLNPNCRPLILAPTIMLRPWQLEFKKWEVNVPIHILNSSRDSKKKRLYIDQDQEVETFTLASGSKISGKNLIDMHRIKAISDWYREGSILMVSYRLFARLTDDTNPRLPAVSRNIGQLLLQSPGLLVLDEGHLARNHESKLRKSLTRVQTRLRILLSGTIFQNNCCELFNTFHLVRPTFMRDVCHSQRGLKNDISGQHLSLQTGHSSQADSISRPRNVREVAALRLVTQRRDIDVSTEDEEFILDIGTEEEVEARARRLFMDKIGKTLENGQRKRGKILEGAIKRLRSMTRSFVHYYAGEVLQSLPGLKDYTILLKTSPMQEKLLHEIAKAWDRGNSLDFEYIVSIVCIHPYLFKHVSCKESCTSVDLAAVGNLSKDPKEGAKVQFIMELVQLCHVKNEKLLIFSQNIMPLHFLEELLQSDRKFLKGDRVFKLHGSLPLDDRQVIINSFNDSSGNVRVLLASMKACGEGITLTGASRVVFLDMVWNPAVTKQAMSRAFRLGQRKEVFVYRLVATGTLEEDKYGRTIWKDWLSRSIFVSSMNGENNDNKPENQAVDKATPSKGRGLHSSTKTKGLQHGLGSTALDDDTILSTILELDREDKTIRSIVKHENCLDQGHMDVSDSEDSDGAPQEGSLGTKRRPL
ncbi:hypothetical protein GOP47_0006882 [Adiantum capillus-veneris]|uniref:Uncharacterized protein n=1 Tax=Adiantum capillus-veneris TaxID=13818 RepID=A0A9D4ZMX5_ADICA|nr:hypothetical protein GOP47_0006882 [Adiantum capillus-veneris]